ncbi:MAG: vancomycin resistance protein [Ruminococcaceae bacterium]|nr:vancomycin resistance protein [Oscillospiraceae bacterium]
MKRKLFCEISPLTYWLSVQKNIINRNLKDFLEKHKFSKRKSNEKLSFLIFEHKSIIRRVLGNVNMKFQENKAKNLSLAVPKIDGIIIYPGEVFSLWKLVGKCKASMGYKEGVTISNSKVSKGIGGGMCQLSNLIHWMILHSPLEIVEHHHHDGFDLFPDYNRKVPFGTGTSITYNYLDYRFKNTTDSAYQLCIYVTENELCGQLRCEKMPEFEYEIRTENECFVKENDGVYRLGDVYRKCTNKKTGEVLWDRRIRQNHAKVMYDTNGLIITDKSN